MRDRMRAARPSPVDTSDVPLDRVHLVSEYLEKGRANAAGRSRTPVSLEVPLRSASVSGVDVYAELPDLLRPLLRVEYDQMVALGVFDEEHIELLEGALVEMSPERADHALVVTQLNRVLTPALPPEWSVRIGHPWAASDRSEPEPDVAVVPTGGDYHLEHPSQARLLIEVSRSSRRKDLGAKAVIYAAARVPEYWVFDLADRVVVRHTGPTPQGYHTVTRHGPSEQLEVEGVGVNLESMFPPPTGA